MDWKVASRENRRWHGRSRSDVPHVKHRDGGKVQKGLFHECEMSPSHHMSGTRVQYIEGALFMREKEKEKEKHNTCTMWPHALAHINDDAAMADVNVDDLQAFVDTFFPTNNSALILP